jgi:signal transduction histidine kinase/CheY-like chemotaxis protein
VLGKHISFLTPRDRPDEMPRMLAKIKDGLPADQVDTVWMTKDGSLSDVSLQVSPIRDERGRVVGASSIARDITKEKQKAEEERRSLEAQLLQAQKLESVGRLAGGVAHDFNNMLAVILGYAEIALQGVGDDDARRNDLEQILQAAERAKGLTRQLLAFARKQVLQMTNLSPNDVVWGFSKMIKRLIGEDIDVTMSLADGLPQVNADPAMMEQVLLNLAVNARDAMPDGGRLTIETKVVHLDDSYATARFEVTPGDYVMLAVSDNGLGMDEQTRQMIFEPFFTTKASGEGTGLGLATVYGIVKQHGGSIWVYSEPGQGTTFKVYFPVADKAETVSRKPVEEGTLPSHGETILVVEDDAGLRGLICAALAKLGYEALCSGGPEEAQALAHQFAGTIHLMLTDVVMPKMNGKALYESLAPLRPAMKVVFMSGYTEDVIAHKGVLEEGINFIQKPFSIRQLARKLGSLLSAGQEAG